MSPRPYQLGQRQASVDATRRKVLDAARSLLADPAGQPAFSVDAVAKKADVARATVYYQFDSKAGLLEALFNSLAANGQLSDLAGAFTNPDPVEGLRRFVACFGRFWGSDRMVLRRIRAIAALDPEVGPLIAARDERRRQGLQVLARRLAGGVGSDGAGGDREARGADGGAREAAGAIVDIIHTLTSFETFDALAGADQEPEDVIPIVTDLVLRVAIGRTPPSA